MSDTLSVKSYLTFVIFLIIVKEELFNFLKSSKSYIDIY